MGFQGFQGYQVPDTFFADAEVKRAPAIDKSEEVSPASYIQEEEIETREEEKEEEPEENLLVHESLSLYKSAAGASTFADSNIPSSPQERNVWMPRHYFDEEGKLLRLSTQEKAKYGIEEVSVKLKFLAPTYLKKTDKTAKAYFQAIKSFYPANFLSVGSDRSPDVTAEGIAALIDYSNCSPEQRHIYLERLQEIYIEWAKFSGTLVLVEEQKAIQKVEIECANLVFQLFAWAEQYVSDRTESFVDGMKDIVQKKTKGVMSRVNLHLDTSINQSLQQELEEFQQQDDK